MVSCPKCNTQNSDGAKFCKKCGILIGDSGKKTCPNGHIMDPTWSECPICKSGSQAMRSPGFHDPSKMENPVPPPGASPQQSPRRKTQAESGRPELGPPRLDTVKEKKRTIVSSLYEGEDRPKAGAPNRLVGFLISFSNHSSGRYFEIREGRYMIGSGDRADIRIPEDGQMSSEHAILLYRRGKFLFQDNLSTNGSFINGEEVIDKTELVNYDIINLGDTELKLLMVDPV